MARLVCTALALAPAVVLLGCNDQAVAGLTWDLPTDCRNETVVEEGGRLPTMSYHIHYVAANSSAQSDMKRFYTAFLEQFGESFPEEKQCPFGPNYGAYNSDTFASGYFCSLEGALEFELAAGVDLQGNPWGSLYQRAFFVPIERIDEAWEWSKANRGEVDLVKHPNSGCMHDDHGLRRIWEGEEHTIYTLQFPCNVPATGCQDNDYSGPPSCGCADERHSDSPADSCENCLAMGDLPPMLAFLA
jgi:hypothetical protein